MKKILMMIAALPLLMASCGSDDDEIEVTPSSAEIKCGASVTLKASTKNVTWSSLDSKIASVDGNGVVTGEHIGSTRINVVDKNGNDGAAEINVVASNNNFAEPLMAWNSTMSAIESAMASWSGLTLSTKFDDALNYTTGGGFPMYIYNFEDDALYASTLAVSTDQDENLDLEGWLDERYWFLTEDDDLGFCYCDSQDLTSASVLISYNYYPDVDAVMVMWVPYDDSTRSGASFTAVRQAAVKALRAAMNK